MPRTYATGNAAGKWLVTAIVAGALVLALIGLRFRSTGERAPSSQPSTRPLRQDVMHKSAQH